MAFTKQEEVWEPISDWGRSMKPYLDQVKLQAVVVIHTPKLRRPRIRAKAEPVAYGKCSLCAGPTGPQNKSGVCSGCCTNVVWKNLTYGPRPTCTVCGIKVNRDNTKGLCAAHKKAA